MQQIALSWLVYRISNSVFLLGIVGFASRIPTFLLAPFAGVLADRWNRHHLVIVIQALAIVQAFRSSVSRINRPGDGMANNTAWLILRLRNSFDVPVRQTFVLDMLEERKFSAMLSH